MVGYLRVPGLGPLGFAVIVNDAAVDTPFVTLKYVDDLTLVESKPYSQKSAMQQYLNDFQQWAFVNNMKLNPNKCASMKVSFLVNDHDDPTTYNFEYSPSGTAGCEDFRCTY